MLLEKLKNRTAMPMFGFEIIYCGILEADIYLLNGDITYETRKFPKKKQFWLDYLKFLACEFSATKCNQKMGYMYLNDGSEHRKHFRLQYVHLLLVCE